MAGRDDQKDREAILARRKMFIASALAGLAIGCEGNPAPQPCLSVAPPPSDAQPSDGAVPQPCLSPMAPPDESATPDGSARPDGSAAGSASEQAAASSSGAANKPSASSGAPPTAVAPTPPRPRVCLRIMRPKTKKTR